MLVVLRARVSVLTISYLDFLLLCVCVCVCVGYGCVHTEMLIYFPSAFYVYAWTHFFSPNNYPSKVDTLTLTYSFHSCICKVAAPRPRPISPPSSMTATYAHRAPLITFNKNNHLKKRGWVKGTDRHFLMSDIQQTTHKVGGVVLFLLHMSERDVLFHKFIFVFILTFV